MKPSMRAAWMGTSPEAWFAAFAAPALAPFGAPAAVRT